jgi:hypothetical protein
VTDFLTEKKREIDSRLRELRPLVEEYRSLEEAAAALGGVRTSPSGTTSTRTRTRTSARPRRASRTRAPARRAGKRPRGRPKGSGTRGKQALKLVKAKPGITIGELAKEMGIKANYLYRVMPGLEKEKKVKRRGRGWHPA